MTLRIFILAISLISSAVLGCPVRASDTPPVDNKMFPPIVFYVAKGADDSCGHGCNTWIAAEGQIDADAADRFRKFIKPLRDRHLPIYFSSPGGNVDQAFAIGNMLRQRPVVARVARTVVRECGDSQVSDACLKIKKSGRDLDAELFDQKAMCNSACPLIMMGAATREIAPDVTFAIHSPRITLRSRGRVTARMIEEATDRGISRLDRSTSSYLAKMGIDHGLLELQRTIKFEDKHFLTREELARFRIDTRPFAESPWWFDSSGQGVVHKMAVLKKTDGAPYRKLEMRLSCDIKDHARLLFIREFDTNATGNSTVLLTVGTDRFVALGARPVRVGAYDMWGVTVSAEDMKRAFAVPYLHVAETVSTPDGKVGDEVFDFDTAGLESAWGKLSASCLSPVNAKTYLSPAGSAGLVSNLATNKALKSNTWSNNWPITIKAGPTIYGSKLPDNLTEILSAPPAANTASDKSKTDESQPSP